MKRISFGQIPTTGKCPLCGAPMVERVVKRGPWLGKKFLGCARYPACTHLVDYPVEPPHDYDGSLDALEGRGPDGQPFGLGNHGVYPERKRDNEDLWDFPSHDDWGW